VEEVVLELASVGDRLPAPHTLHRVEGAGGGVVGLQVLGHQFLLAVGAGDWAVRALRLVALEVDGQDRLLAASVGAGDAGKLTGLHVGPILLQLSLPGTPEFLMFANSQD
jgi:hypothetical protein